jgi:hypothetical protein
MLYQISFNAKRSKTSPRKPALENMNDKGIEGDKPGDSENLAVLFGDRQRERSIECKRHAVHGQDAYCDALAWHITKFGRIGAQALAFRGQDN